MRYTLCSIQTLHALLGLRYSFFLCYNSVQRVGPRRRRQVHSLKRLHPLVTGVVQVVAYCLYVIYVGLASPASHCFVNKYPVAKTVMIIVIIIINILSIELIEQ